MNFGDLEKIAKLSTRKNFYETYQAPWCIYNHKLRDSFSFWIMHDLSLLFVLPFLFFLPVPWRSRKSNV